MRELLSAYVDGELRDTDAARVEELSKRDAELRREIASYRKLRKKLKDWDEAEHGHAPPPTLERRVLSRVRAWVGERREARRGRIVSLLFNPVTVAAALLLAIGGGLLAERAVPPATPPTPVAQGEILIEPAAPLPELAVKGSALRPYEEPADDYIGGFDEIVRRRMDSWARMTVMLKEQEHCDRLRDRLARAPERVQTGEPRNLHLLAMLSTSEAVAKPYESLVLMRQPVVTGHLPAARALRAGTRIAMDQNTTAGRIYVDLRAYRGPAVLAPLGEVWIGARDGSGRTRVVTKSDWIARYQMVAVTWADEISPPVERSYDLEVQDFILGPRARKLLLASSAQDDLFRGWLKKNYGAATLAKAFQRGAKKRERTVARLTAALDRDPEATGFTFIDAEGKLRGVELFANHSLMMAFAPRLLRGYLLEAGEKGASLEMPSSDGTLLKRVEEFLETVPRGSARLEEIKLDRNRKDEWPKGLKRVHVMRHGRIIGHGLVDSDYRPVHVAIFGG
ncbi:MAG: ARPP-1 family domain-containing protein [Planctomycetota bacterium]